MNYLSKLDKHRLFKMSVVKRWAIIDTAKDQSVAEHSFNVAIITLHLAEKVFNYIELEQGVDAWSEVRSDIVFDYVVYALLHDYDETLTGDVPTPVKGYMKPALDFVAESLCSITGSKWFITKGNKDSITGVEAILLAIVKLADMIDASVFADKYVVGRIERGQVLPDIGTRLLKACDNLSSVSGIKVEAIKAMVREWTVNV